MRSLSSVPPALEGVCLTHHCPVRIRAERDYSDRLGDLLEAGERLPSIPPAPGPRTWSYTRRVFKQGESYNEVVTETLTEAA